MDIENNNNNNNHNNKSFQIESISIKKYIIVLLIFSISILALLITSTILPWSYLPKTISIQSETFYLRQEYRYYQHGPYLPLIIASMVLLSVYGVILMVSVTKSIKKFILYIFIQVIPPLSFSILIGQLIMLVVYLQPHKVQFTLDPERIIYDMQYTFSFPLARIQTMGGRQYYNHLFYQSVITFSIGFALSAILMIINIAFRRPLKNALTHSN